MKTTRPPNDFAGPASSNGCEPGCTAACYQQHGVEPQIAVGAGCDIVPAEPSCWCAAICYDQCASSLGFSYRDVALSSVAS